MLAMNRPFTPPILNLLVTRYCTLKCRHCFNWRISEDAGANDLTLEEIQRISMNLGNVLYLVLAGGEPFLRTDLPEIVATFYRNNLARNQVILTDGQLTERILAYTPRMLKECPGLYLTIGVAFDGLAPDHDRIRGTHGAFDQALHTFLGLKTLQQRTPRLDLQTCSVLMAENQVQFHGLLDFIRDRLQPDKLSLNLIRQAPRDPSLLAVSIETYESITRRIQEETFRGKIKNKSTHDAAGIVTLVDLLMHTLIANTVRTKTPQLVCRAGTISGVISSDGHMGPCEILPWLGNLRDAGFNPNRLWFSGEASVCREEIRRGCFCTHEIDCFLPSIPFNPHLYPDIVRLGYQWKRVARWRKVN